MSEPPIGIEPMTYALRGACSDASHALAAPIAWATARVALMALGLSGDPVHEPVHARSRASPHPDTAQTLLTTWIRATTGHGARPTVAHSPVSRRPDLPMSAWGAERAVINVVPLWYHI